MRWSTVSAVTTLAAGLRPVSWRAAALRWDRFSGRWEAEAKICSLFLQMFFWEGCFFCLGGRLGCSESRMRGWSPRSWNSIRQRRVTKWREEEEEGRRHRLITNHLFCLDSPPSVWFHLSVSTFWFLYRHFYFLSSPHQPFSHFLSSFPPVPLLVMNHSCLDDVSPRSPSSSSLPAFQLLFIPPFIRLNLPQLENSFIFKPLKRRRSSEELILDKDW